MGFAQATVGAMVASMAVLASGVPARLPRR